MCICVELGFQVNLEASAFALVQSLMTPFHTKGYDELQ